MLTHRLKEREKERISLRLTFITQWPPGMQQFVQRPWHASSTAEGSSRFQSAIEDGAFPECALGIVHSLNVTAFMSINTPAIYAGSLLLAGNPVAYAVTPYVLGPRTLPMGVVQRVANCLTHVFADLLHWVS